MFYIKLDKAMNLVVTSREPLYRGDHLCRKLTYLLPLQVGDIDIGAAAVYLSYIRADGTADIDLLNRQKELYNKNYYQFTMPVTSRLTQYAGPVTTFLTIYTGPYKTPIIDKSSECVLLIQASPNMDEYISDRNLGLIYDMQRHMEDKVEKAKAALNERIDKTNETVAAKADNIVFNEKDSTIQLVSTVPILDEDGNIVGFQQILLGDPIFVCANTVRGIANMEINADGCLIATFDDGEIKNLGNVVGKDGVVYVPHIDEHNVLTFTIETDPGKIPGPIDLNPNDEWADMGDDDVESAGNRTDYIWEKM